MKMKQTLEISLIKHPSVKSREETKHNKKTSSEFYRYFPLFQSSSRYARK